MIPAVRQLPISVILPGSPHSTALHFAAALKSRFVALV